ncbi:fumarylacetoacetate hydrolase [Pseudozyma hubeiensis SY62]|uniref:Fumarylacetoacetate hydrolase n=1 Tax=Pseudozyma hubeiensis (strain SY62) TaxID=1305764 RepID=R9P1M9_PSEHS|nr:fumarylacetoacetate hydrolase [Pseudozyma hubeiensis SY62]GAC95151.1 fumarylacetoacetate hydrolase [Pseudozyma hubeiensis SY62]
MLELPWTRLVRFVDQQGVICYGNLFNEGDDHAQLLEGEGPFSLRATGKQVAIGKILGPLTPADVPLVRCIGLNYATHLRETGHPNPTNPTLFIKPAPAVADHNAAIPVPKIAQGKMDYEGELTILIGKDCKNVKPEDALDVIAAYTVGNDLSARDWQTEPEKAGSRPQWCFGKSFDQFAPVGPYLVSPKLVGDCKGSTLSTYVNGERRQLGEISDLVFGVRDLVAFCSQGQTLEQGTLIMTGTPGGVGLFMNPKTFLQDGDEVVVTITQIGSLRNTLKFE